MIKTLDASRTKNFLASLASCSSKPAILSLVEPYSSRYIPKAADGSLPLCFTILYRAAYLNKNYSELLKIGKTVEIEATRDEVEQAEVQTRSQAQSRLWQKMRAGRITASRFKAACHTNPSKPSTSLIMSIQWNLSKRTLRERDTVLNTSPQRTKPNPQIYPSLSI